MGTDNNVKGSTLKNSLRTQTLSHQTPTLAEVPSNESLELEQVINSITGSLSRKAYNTWLKVMAKTSPSNASTICGYILAEQTERNIKPSTIEGKIKVLIWLSKYLQNKPFENMTKQDILAYLNHLRKPTSDDPTQRWIGSYNGRQIIFLKFFKWLYDKDEADQKKRKTPDCMKGIKQLPRQDKTPYKPADLWTAQEHAIFLKYCPNKRDRCYHAMANDTSARPHELLNLKIKDLTFKESADGKRYVEITIAGGKTRARNVVLTDSLPYVKDWLQAHPYGDNKEAWLFVSQCNNSAYGQRLQRDSLLMRYKNDYRQRIFPHLLDDVCLPDADKAIIRSMLTKVWNLYIFRHSALTEKAQLLPEYSLRNHAGWTMTSKQPATYLHFFGSESARKILEVKGYTQSDNKPLSYIQPRICPHCKEPNKPDSKFCINPKCNMILSYEAYEDSQKALEKFKTERDNFAKQLLDVVRGEILEELISKGIPREHVKKEYGYDVNAKKS